MKNKVLLKAALLTPLALSVNNVNARTQLLKNKKPNILFCICDDASLWSFGAYGCDYVKTPTVDKLAKEGAVFNNVFTSNPKSAPSRAMLCTGRYSWQLKAATNHYCFFPKEFTSYPITLMKNGYHVGFTGKGWGPGVFSTKYNPAGPEYNTETLIPPYKGIHKNNYALDFSKFLDANKDNKPFCMWMGFFEPHRFYEKDSWKKEGIDTSKIQVPPIWPDNGIIRGDISDYLVEIQWVDKQMAKIMKTLKDKDLLDNTLIIFTSDHGMPFPRIKGQIYEDGFHVPFIAYWKGVIKAGRTIDDFISFPDVAPTLLDVAGVPKDKQMTGKSFLNVLKSEKSGVTDSKRDHAVIGKERHDVGRSNEEGNDLGYPVRAIRTNQYLYIKNFKPERWPAGNPEYGFKNCDSSPTKSFLINIKPSEPNYYYFTLNFGKRPSQALYDIKADENCLKNLIYNPAYSKIVKKLKEKMISDLKKQGDPRMFGKGEDFNKYPYAGKQCIYDKTNETNILK